MAKAKTYIEKLQDPRWQKKRLLIFQRDNWACLDCGSTTKTLHVHHIKYFGINPWEYADEFMRTLCKDCHAKEHDLIPDSEVERKHEHLIIRTQEPEVITSINQQITSLQNKLQEEISDNLMTEILKNIMFLMEAKKKLLKK